MKIFTQVHIPYIGEINKGNRQGSMHSFSSTYTALIKTFSVSRIVYSGRTSVSSRADKCLAVKRARRSSFNV